MNTTYEEHLEELKTLLLKILPAETATELVNAIDALIMSAERQREQEDWLDH